MTDIIITAETVLPLLELDRPVEQSEIEPLLGIDPTSEQRHEQRARLFRVLEALVADDTLHVGPTGAYWRPDQEASHAAVMAMIAPTVQALSDQREREHNTEFFAQYA